MNCGVFKAIAKGKFGGILKRFPQGVFQCTIIASRRLQTARCKGPKHEGGASGNGEATFNIIYTLHQYNKKQATSPTITELR